MREVVPRVAEMAVLQAQNFFREKFFVETFGVGEFVRQKIINRIKSRRRHVTDAADLNRRGLIRQHVKGIVCGVPRKVNEDVNFVVDDAFGDFSRRFVEDVAEIVDSRRELLGYVVGDVLA